MKRQVTIYRPDGVSEIFYDIHSVERNSKFLTFEYTNRDGVECKVSTNMTYLIVAVE